jgi:uncharacterized membrane protein
MNPMLITGVGLVCTVLFVHAMYSSSRRLASLGYAVLGFAIVVVLGVVSTMFLVPSHASLLETNSVLDKVSAAATIGALVAAVWGANMPPRRAK